MNTAHNNLRLSDRNKQVTWSDEALCYPQHPERFDTYNQVLGKECLHGTSYWEVEWTGENGVNVAVTYPGIIRSNDPCGIYCVVGYNTLSWSLQCSPKHCCFRHRGKEQKIAVPRSNRVGVYIDDNTLSFYSVSDTMRLLYKEEIKFNQLILPALWIGVGSKAKLCY